MWEIYAYQNSNSLFGILNAVAAIAGAATFKSALAITAFCGFVAALAAYAIAPHKLQGWQWLASVTLVLSVLFVPRVTVGIIDKTGGSPPSIVGNVPLGLAVFGSLSSTVGNALTELYEMAMQVLPGPAALPSELTYQKNGLLFGNRLIKEASGVVFQHPSFRMDLINFINNCTIYDLASGDISADVFATSDNVWPLMASPNPARFTTVTDAAGAQVVVQCTEAYQKLNARMPAQVERIKGTLAFKLNPTLPGVVAASIVAGQIQQAYIKNGIASAATDAADIIRQNALINAVNDTSLIVGQRINDPASMLLAVGRAQAVAQTNAAWVNNGKIAEQALPVIRNAIEALTYAIFPIVVLLLMMTNGQETMKGLKNYLSVLVWIQLWPPLYAVLNYMAMIFAAQELAAASTVGSGVNSLSLMTSSSIYSTAISGEAVVGYLTLSIPLIAWAGLKRMETFGSALIGSVQMLQSATTASTNSTALGNVSMGNSSMDQITLSPTRSSPFFSSRQDSASGNTYTSNALSGLTAAKALTNEGPVSRVVDTKVSQQHVVAASKSVAAARVESLAAAEDKAAALADVLMKADTRSSGQNSSSGTNSSSSESIGERVNELQQIAKTIAATTGTTEQQVASIAFGGAAHFGVGIPGVMRKFSPVDAGTQLTGEARKSYSASAQQQEQLINNALTSEDKSRFKAFSDMISRNASLVSSIISDHRSGRDLSARLTESLSRSEKAEANLRTQTDFSEIVSGAYQRGETFSKDLAKDPRNIQLFEELLKLEPSGSAAELVKMESYLGNMATTPVPMPSSSNLPRSFDDINERYNVERERIKSGGEVEARFEQYKKKVSQPTVKASKPTPLKPHDEFNGARQVAPTSMFELRKEISDAGKRVAKEVEDRQSDFKRQGVRTSSDGHLMTESSLLHKANSQVANDPDVIAKSTKDLLDKATQALSDKKK